MDGQLIAKTLKITSLKNLYVYGKLFTRPPFGLIQRKNWSGNARLNDNHFLTILMHINGYLGITCTPIMEEVQSQQV